MAEKNSRPLIPVNDRRYGDDWRAASALQGILGILNAGHDTPQALIVGGAVRNTLCGHTVKDIDIATRHTPEKVQALCTEAGWKTIPTGLKHGTVTAVDESGHSFEVTTLRRDVETDGRHAKVAFTDDWQEDAQRRDFTMNVLYMDAQGAIYDPLGQGFADATAGYLRFVGNPAARIEEDALRILRFFRFWAIYGRGAADEQALQACADKADMLARLSKERITAEIFKILMAPRSVAALTLMANHGILQRLDVQGFDKARFSSLIKAQEKFNRNNVLSRFFEVFFAGVEGAACAHFVLSNAEKRFLHELEDLQSEYTQSGDILTPVRLRRLLYAYGKDAVEQFLLLNNNALHERLDSLIKERDRWQRPVFPVSGQDMKALGISEGRAMGEILKKLEARWIDSDFTLSKADLLATLD